MTSQLEPTPQKQKQDEFRRFLIETVQESTSVSYEKFGEIFNKLALSRGKELYESFQKEIINSIEPVTEALITQTKINKKVDKLTKLIKETSVDSNYEAWRPVTGELDIVSIEGQPLEKRKAKLLEAIKGIDQENEDLVELIKKKYEILNESKCKLDNSKIK